MRAACLAWAVLQNQVGAVPRPSWCTYLATYRCNARCRMCDSWRIEPGDELSAEQVGEVFGKLRRLDVVRLSGGEPFLRRDLPQIAEQILRRAEPAVLHVTTNGSFPERVVEFVERCSQPRKLRLMVSFDGLAQEHDRNRGKAVTFARALEAVRGLAALRKTHGTEVSVNHTVISPRSLEDNRGLRELMSGLGVEVHSVLAYADSAMYGAQLSGRKAEHLIEPAGYPLHPLLRGADAAGFVRDEWRWARRYRSLLLRWGKRYYLRGLLARLPAGRDGDGQADAKPNPRCVALRSHIRILPDGGVPVCQFNTERVGNLLRQPLAEVWHSGRAAASRAWVDACPGCWAECEVMPSAVYSGDILRGWH